MITYNPHYTGWLGNQMFQYAASFALGLRTNTPIFFPTKTPNLFDIFKLKDRPEFLEGDYTSHIEPEFSYNEIALIEDNMLLFGYYQSEKYFEDFKNEIRKEFSFKNPTSIKIEPNTTSLHVRRGDYLNIPDHHPLCSLDYYKEAVSLLDDPNILVFSDDMEWCKENLKGDNFTYSEDNSPSVDLELMSKCDNHIIANSSYSWWGAWLGKNVEKKVIAPSKWFGPSKSNCDTQDLYCKDWIVL